jgi:hypothetical protein
MVLGRCAAATWVIQSAQAANEDESVSYRMEGEVAARQAWGTRQGAANQRRAGPFFSIDLRPPDGYPAPAKTPPATRHLTL